ncbi:hypothetical protein ACFYY5_29560 [Nocardia elegans]|uniref:Head-to-tail stopper n=1 Tax=Nocardia elegans TaxID=300029 RepID=A0ABW6TNT9_9NOCA
MVRYQAPKYPRGIKLTVIRHTGEPNWEGDYEGTPTEHQIGPCDLKWLSNTEDNTTGEQLQMLAQITAPAGSDVVAADKVRLPDGRIYVIDGDVKVAPNAFTGWASGVRFRIAKDAASGIRR